MDFSNLIHKGIMDDDKWIKMPLERQMGNIGSELSRLVHWKKKQNDVNMNAAWDRVLELIDLTVYGLNKYKKTSACREVLRLREVLCDYAGDFGHYGADGEKLVEYCTQFVLIGKREAE